MSVLNFHALIFDLTYIYVLFARITIFILTILNFKLTLFIAHACVHKINKNEKIIKKMKFFLKSTIHRFFSLIDA